MRKKILVIGVIVLFIGTASFSAATSNNEVQLEKKDEAEQCNRVVRYVLFGRIKSYDIIEYDGIQYLECTAIVVRSIWFDVFPEHPNLILPSVLRFGQMFNIPYEGAKIYGPTSRGNYFISAAGVIK